VAPGLSPEKIPLRAVSDALSAVQDLASGRDPFETSHVPEEKAIAVVKVRRGSAVYACVSHAPDEAREKLAHVGVMLSSEDGHDMDGDGLIAALQPIQSLSGVARLLSDATRSIRCRVEVALIGQQSPLFVIEEDAYERVSSRLLLVGDTTVVGSVQRVGGATGERCMLHIPGRRRGLYCDVQGRDLARRLGEHLYEQIAAAGTATWIHRSWRIYRFTIRDFTQPELGGIEETIEQLRNAGLKAWDQIGDPDAFLREMRS
jgi:hypothetical protein